MGVSVLFARLVSLGVVFRLAPTLFGATQRAFLGGKKCRSMLPSLLLSMFLLLVKPGQEVYGKRLDVAVLQQQQMKDSIQHILSRFVCPNRCIDEGSDSLDLLCQCAGTISNLAEDARNQVGTYRNIDHWFGAFNVSPRVHA